MGQVGGGVGRSDGLALQSPAVVQRAHGEDLIIGRRFVKEGMRKGADRR